MYCNSSGVFVSSRNSTVVADNRKPAVPCVNGHDANSTGPGPGCHLGLLSANYEDLLNRVVVMDVVMMKCNLRAEITAKAFNLRAQGASRGPRSYRTTLMGSEKGTPQM